MAMLYIANCMKQTYDFAYRIPGDEFAVHRRLNTVSIPPGAQARIHGEAPMPVLEAIVEQHRAYGIMPVDEIVRTREFVGICFSFDKPVPIDQLQYAIDHNTGVLFDRGEQQRQDAAIVVDQALEGTIGQPMRSVELEVIEEADAPKLASGMRVTRDPEVARARARRGG